jgi:hypothetical protein
VRLPRFFGKKRGHRRTGSEAWGSFGDGLFHGAVLVAGLAFGGFLVSGVAVPEWRINHDFVATTCTIVAKGLERRSVTDAGPGAAPTFRPFLGVRYAAGAADREAWVAAPRSVATPDRAAAVARLDGWRLGAELPGWYDPANMGRVVLTRGYNWWTWLLTLVLPGALIAFGTSGLARTARRWNKSEECRAAIRPLPGLLVPLAEAPRTADGHPGVPACDDMVNSPGTILRYRLPIESPESWTLLGFGLFALLWNAVLLVLAVNAGLGLVGGRVDWFLLALLVPFVAVGVTGIVLFIRLLVLATAVGTTQVEINEHPLRPGGRYELIVAQGGSGTFRTLDVAIAMEEQATFRQGTDTRSERLTVWSQDVHSWRDLQCVPGTRFEARTTLEIPASAMHSFASEHNSVRWLVVVRGRPARWPAFTRTFPVIVFPESPPAGTPSAEAGR